MCADILENVTISTYSWIKLMIINSYLFSLQVPTHLGKSCKAVSACSESTILQL
jgi:hypothetical protein